MNSSKVLGNIGVISIIFFLLILILSEFLYRQPAPKKGVPATSSQPLSKLDQMSFKERQNYVRGRIENIRKTKKVSDFEELCEHLVWSLDNLDRLQKERDNALKISAELLLNFQKVDRERKNQKF